ncbi:synaptojanin-1-like [Stegodyphus dumicola]|uniref:synaptojanin-1-like n=1 Tax=Stegodyphus dumicola TaxID=202533 RepID=UPI0015AE8A33|nr:synaptojanin-1-like [Stegodyphus dumicola]
MVELQKTISRDNKYIYITSTQLVGVCLFLFALPKHAPFIKDVAVDVVKTGLRGAAGNKGGVSIRLMLYNTSMCFVCAHLAAGQSEVFERNANYEEITKKLNFPLGRTLDSHEYVFWCGDFNYRIDLQAETVRKLVKEKNWPALLAADQLINQRQAGQVFHDFIEAPINFPPTYKYDVFSDDYDTSEKNRIPSYTDRVLYKRRSFVDGESEYPGNIVYYGRAELKTSDHRPVIALIDVEVLHINGPKRLEIFEELIESGPPDGTIIVSFETKSVKPEVFLKEDFKYKLLHEIFKEKVSHMRIIGDEVYVIFKEVKFALEALDYNDKEMNGCILKVRLKTPDWRADIYKVLKLCQNNTVSLTPTSSVASHDADFLSCELADGEDDHQTLHKAVAELNKEVLKCFDSKNEWSSVLEGYNDSDYDVSKSQPSSGRSSPFTDGGSERLKSSPVKLPPRPPPPSRPSAPQRPPPPQLSRHTDGSMNDKSKAVNDSTCTSEKEKIATAEIQYNDEKDNYISAPPPSGPPPPLPFHQDLLQSLNSAEAHQSVPEESSKQAAQPPPIPLRPKHLAASAVGQPPPLPARSSAPSQQTKDAPSVVPRKSVQ